MLRIKKKISNPMTVIAIFALISETSAAVSLPFLDIKEREIYVWFLISFPFYLLLLFFITLNFNYRSLYAPSDFEKDKSFLKASEDNERNDKKDSPAKSPAALTGLGITTSILYGESGVSTGKHPPRTHNALDPPATLAVSPDLNVQHVIRLPTLVNNLQIIDARQQDAKCELATILGKIRNSDKKNARVAVFLANHVSDVLLRQNPVRPVKNFKKGTDVTYCIIYNVCTHAVIVSGDF